MKSLLVLVTLLSLSNNSFAGEKTNKVVFKSGAAMLSSGYSIGSYQYAQFGKELAATTGASTEFTVVLTSATAVAAAAIGGYMIGSVIVEADKAYFHGSLISKTGQFLGPINRRIYNMINKDTLPEVLETDKGDLKVLSDEQNQ
jgi:hypothetical protein